MFASRFLFLIFFASTIANAGYYPRAVACPVHCRSAYDDIEVAGKVAVTIGCLAAIGYGIYKFCDWLFTPSDEKVLQRGIDAVQNAHIHYDSTIGFMEFHYSGIPDNVRDQKKLIQDVNEPLLYDYAISYKKDSTIDSVLMNMNSTISSLQAAHGGLADRIKKLRKNDGNQNMIASMQQVDQEIIGLLCKLEFVHEYFMHHRSYYSLFELESRLLRTYEFELSAINQYQVNKVEHSYLKEAIKASVMRQACARSGYPYMHYVDRANADCNALNYAMSSLSYNYANRIAAAGSLLQNVKIVHTIAVAEDAYHQELRDYKKEQLERQRLEAEKAKAAAAAAQAAAAQQQVREMQRQNQLHAQQNRIQAERNAIIATQAMVNAMNPQPQVNVYV